MHPEYLRFIELLDTIFIVTLSPYHIKITRRDVGIMNKVTSTSVRVIFKAWKNVNYREM
ncbi:hypothetical protein [Flavobacterium sp.]|jgi:hypothetical protein|uniref:hypothetical protein n=1 Tax=Flavobacterium sp. TaxID=239 RepID=UPI0037C1619A